METFYPDYYSAFTCTADKCPVTCCQEWKIYVDDMTKEKWKSLTPPECVGGHKKNLNSFTEKKEGQRVIRLTDDHRCPFLTENLLCSLVLTYDTDILSETCITFPREYHDFVDHREASLMPCCPAVIDLWKQKKCLTFPEASSVSPDPAFLLREKITALIQGILPFTESSLNKAPSAESLTDQSRSPDPSRLPAPPLTILQSFYILQELYRKEEKGQLLTAAVIEDCFTPTTLSELQKAIYELPSSAADTILECNELLQDLAVNYLEEGLYTEYLEPLITQAEQLSDMLQDTEDMPLSSAHDPSEDPELLRNTETDRLLSDWNAFCLQLETFYPLLRSFLANEMYSDLLAPDDTSTEHMLVRLQWTAIQYAAIRQALFLTYLSENKGILSYESVRQAIVILTRMTGYEEEDIYEYLENSFESLIWDFGYLAFIMGNVII